MKLLPTITFEDVKCSVYVWLLFLAFLLGCYQQSVWRQQWGSRGEFRSHKSSSVHLLFAQWHFFKENPPSSSNELVAVWLVHLLKSQRVNLAFFWNVKKRLNVMVMQWTHSITVSVPGTHPIPRKSAWRLSCASSLFHLFTSRLIYFPWCVAQMKLFTCI